MKKKSILAYSLRARGLKMVGNATRYHPEELYV